MIGQRLDELTDRPVRFALTALLCWNLGLHDFVPDATSGKVYEPSFGPIKRPRRVWSRSCHSCGLGTIDRVELVPWEELGT